jgi:hypothetical protein
MVGMARTMALPGTPLIWEANAAGYQLLEQHNFVKDRIDYFLVFGAK